MILSNLSKKRIMIFLFRVIFLFVKGAVTCFEIITILEFGYAFDFTILIQNYRSRHQYTIVQIPDYLMISLT